MPQPKSNEAIVEEIKYYDENVKWVCYPDDVLKLLAQKDKEVAEAKERLRVHIEREVIDPLIDTSKPKFGVNEAIDTLRDIIRITPKE